MNHRQCATEKSAMLAWSAEQPGAAIGQLPVERAR
jgi:hypothetical protein